MYDWQLRGVNLRFGPGVKAIIVYAEVTFEDSEPFLEESVGNCRLISAVAVEGVVVASLMYLPELQHS